MHRNERYPCKFCDYKATNKSGLNTHVKTMHQTNEIIICKDCNKTMKRSYLHCHRKLFHSALIQYDCNLCTYQTRRKNTLKTHVITVHQESKKVICKDCNKTMKKKRFSQHRKSFHSALQSQYECNLCTFQTRHKNSLEKHVKTHVRIRIQSK